VAKAKAAKAKAKEAKAKAKEARALEPIPTSFVLAAMLLVINLLSVLAGTVLTPVMCLLLVRRSVYSTLPNPM
jgi:hypothetical protein